MNYKKYWSLNFNRFWYSLRWSATINYFSKQRGTGVNAWADGRQSHTNQYISIIPYHSTPKKKPPRKNTNNNRPVLHPYNENDFQPFLPKVYRQDLYNNYEHFQTNSPREYLNSNPLNHYDENTFYIRPSSSSPQLYRTNKHDTYLNPIGTNYDDQNSHLSYYIDNSKTIRPHVEISPVSPNKTVLPTRRPQITSAISTSYDQQNQKQTVESANYDNRDVDKEDEFNTYEQYTTSKPTRNKYENIHNPFANPDFNFDEFLNSFKEQQERDRIIDTSSQYNIKSESDINQSFTSPRQIHKPDRNNYSPQIRNKVIPSHASSLLDIETNQKYPHFTTERYYSTSKPDIITLRSNVDVERHIIPQLEHYTTQSKPHIQGYNEPYNRSNSDYRYKTNITSNYNDQSNREQSMPRQQSNVNRENNYIRSTPPPVDLRTPIPFVASTIKPLYDQEINTNVKTKERLNEGIKTVPSQPSDIKDYENLNESDNDDEYYDEYEYEYDESDKPNPYNNNKESPYILPNENPQVVIKQQVKYSSKYDENSTKGKARPQYVTASPTVRTTARPIKNEYKNIISTTTTTTRPIYTIRQRVKSTVRTTTITPRVTLRQRHKNDETRQNLYIPKDR